MTVEAEIVSSELPSKVKPDTEIPWQISIRTTGTGEDYIGGALFERPVSSGDTSLDRSAFILTDQQGNPVKVPPNTKASGTIRVPPLDQWLDPIPETLEWSAIVGWLERTNENEYGLHATDRRDHTVAVEKPPVGGVWEWIKDNPEVVVVGSVGAVGLAYVATR